jgi:hypothetical protein
LLNKPMMSPFSALGAATPNQLRPWPLSLRVR